MPDPTIPMRPFDQSLPMALLGAREATMRRFRPLLADHGLTEQQWRVLRALTTSDRPLDLGDLAERTALLAPSLSRIVARLDADGIIARTVAAHDQRRAEIRLTRKGRALVRRVAPASEAAYNEIEQSFGSDRLRRLLTELHDLALLTDPDRTTP